MQIYQFPTPIDRRVIRAAILAYAAGRISRQRMMGMVSEVLDKFRVHTMNVGEFQVRALFPVITSQGIFPAVLISANKRVHDGKCPACKGRAKGYLAGEAPVVTFGCFDCGCIYEEVVPDAETGKSS